MIIVNNKIQITPTEQAAFEALVGSPMPRDPADVLAWMASTVGAMVNGSETPVPAPIRVLQ